jgi:hypothetical protein
MEKNNVVLYHRIPIFYQLLIFLLSGLKQMDKSPSNKTRLIWIIVIILALIGVAAAIRRALIIENIIPSFSPPKYPGFDSGFSKHRALTFFHIIPGSLFMILGPLLFIKKIKNQNINLYKRIRASYFICAYIVGVSALAMSYTVSIGGANETAATTTFALFFLYCLTKALTNTLNGNNILYREWVLRSFAIGLAIATTRPIIGIFFAVSPLSPHEFFGTAFWLAFTLHLIIVEAWIRYTRYRPIPLQNL